jgi:hypothetical protein
MPKSLAAVTDNALGRTEGHQREHNMAANEEKPMAAAGETRWTLTRRRSDGREDS